MQSRFMQYSMCVCMCMCVYTYIHIYANISVVPFVQYIACVYVYVYMHIFIYMLRCLQYLSCIYSMCICIPFIIEQVSIFFFIVICLSRVQFSCPGNGLLVPKFGHFFFGIFNLSLCTLSLLLFSYQLDHNLFYQSQWQHYST